MNFITQNLEEHYSSKLLLFVYDRERKPYLAYKTKLNLGEKYLNLLEESITRFTSLFKCKKVYIYRKKKVI